MRLRFTKDHLSITQFEDVDLPEFSIITGVNGAGKTHLLQAIHNKSVQIVDRPQANVVLFNYQNFRLQNEGRVHVFEMESERKQLWKTFEKESKGKSVRQVLEDLIKSTLNDSIYCGLKDIASEIGKPLLSLTHSDIRDEGVFQQFINYKNNIESTITNSRQIDSHQKKSALLGLARRVKVGIHELEESEFVELLDMTAKGGVIPTQLSRVFSDYYSKFDANRYRAFRNDQCGESLEVLSDAKFVERHGPKPWDVINEILERFGTLPYRISTPEDLDRNDEFIAELQHQTRPEVNPTFENLSSGEKVLMALVATVYTSTAVEGWPDVLLLDEVDASLHPSMIQNLLDVIADTFLVRGMAVVLVSHSPTTLALAPEEAVFIMNPSGACRIVKKSKKEALSILTEGFATLDEGVKLFDQVSRSGVVVLTEGRNTSYIRRLLSLNNVSGVDVLDGLADRSGKAQLKSMYDFFVCVPHDTFVLVVWDPDATEHSGLAEANKTIPFVLEHNTENVVATKGIENLFPQELFTDFKKTLTDSRGNVVESFDSKRKADFERFVLSRNDPQDFQKFEPLLLKIQEIASMAMDVQG